MKKTADAIIEVLEGSTDLLLPFHENLLNLTQLARFIRPQVEARLHRKVSESSLIMSLSRITNSKTKIKKATKRKTFSVENISVLSGLLILTLERTSENFQITNHLHAALRKRDAYITLSEGTSEITIIFEERWQEALGRLIPKKPKMKIKHVSALLVRFSSHYLSTPGFLHLVLQQIFLQGINIAEIASTSTELILYLDQKDIRLAFDTIMKVFIERKPKHE